MYSVHVYRVKSVPYFNCSTLLSVTCNTLAGVEFRPTRTFTIPQELGILSLALIVCYVKVEPSFRGFSDTLVVYRIEHSMNAP